MVGCREHAFLGPEKLEQRLLLTISAGLSYPAYITTAAAATTPLEQAEAAALLDTQGPTLMGNNGPMEKIGQNLAEIYEEHRIFEASSDGSGNFVPSNSEIQVSGNDVAVDVIAADGDVATLESALTGLGMTITASADQVVSGWFPIDQLSNLPAASGLNFARASFEPIAYAGLVDAQSDKALQADTARMQNSVDGTGITVGVISDSFNTSGVGSEAADVASGDLPAAGVNVLGDSPDSTDEGRAMAQIVHDIAPGAAIAFDAGGEGETGMAAAIDALQSQAGAQVIVDDLGFLDEPFYQDDSIVSQAVNTVAGKGVAYFSAEGNEGTGYQAAFTPSNETGPDGGKLQNFGGSTQAVLQPITIPVGAEADFSFQWAQPFASLGGAGSQSQMNFYIVAADGKTILSNDGSQNDLGGDALQEVAFANDGSFHYQGLSTPDTQFYIAIELASGPAPTNLGYVEFGPDGGFAVDKFDTQSPAAFGHPTAAGDIGVAAAAFFNTPAYGATTPVLDSYSSAGGIPILYDGSGNLLSTPIIRQSPAVTGVDGVDTTFFGSAGPFPDDTDSYPNFFGTSAAAPSVAAVAALMLQAAGGPGSLTPAQIRSDLETSATPDTGRQDPFLQGTVTPIPGPVGTNFFGGFGLVNAVTAVTLAVPVAAGPRAVDDTAETNENAPVAIDVLGNDIAGSSGAIDPTTVTIAQQPANGNLQVNPATGVVTYTPASNFFGDDSFTYTVKDVNGNVSNVATVSIIVNFAVTRPIAVADVSDTNENVSVTIPVLANDIAGTYPIDPASVAVVVQPSNGSVQVNPQTGLATYVPNHNFYGTDSFSYTISDTHGNVSNVASVAINVHFVNQLPVAENDVASTQVSTPVTINVLANDFDPDGNLVPSSLTIVRQPLNGTAQIVNNQIVYTPQAGYLGGDSLAYTVADNDGGVSNVASVAIRVGDPVQISGFAYVDSNDDGIKESGEVGIPGVTVELTKTDGNYTFTTFALTGADGSYHFVEGTNYVLPAGVYDVKEIQPGFFVPGTATMGTPAAAGPNSNAQFDNITLTPDEQASGYNFGSQGLSATFAAAYFNRRAFLASTGPNFTGLNLQAGPNWVSYDTGIQGTLTAVAQFNPALGNVTLTLVNTALEAVATSTAVGGQAELNFADPSSSQYFLKVTGTNPNATVNSYLTATPAVAPPPTPTYHNTQNPLDVNGDGRVTAADALVVINDLNAAKAGAIAQLSGLGGEMVDVNDDGILSAADALAIINFLNVAAAAQAAPAVAGAALESSASAAQPAVLTAAVLPAIVPAVSLAPGGASAVDTSSVAFALAIAHTVNAMSPASPAGNTPGSVATSNASTGSASAGSASAGASPASTTPAGAVAPALARTALRPASSSSDLASLIWTSQEPW